MWVSSHALQGCLEPFDKPPRRRFYALRTLRKSPGFTIVAVLALAIGIGANTAIFSLIDAIREKALPYKDPSTLVELWGTVVRAKIERRGASYPDYLDW